MGSTQCPGLAWWKRVVAGASIGVECVHSQPVPLLDPYDPKRCVPKSASVLTNYFNRRSGNLAA